MYKDQILMDGITDMVFVVTVKNKSEFIYYFINRAAIDKTGLTQNIIGKTIGEVHSKNTAKFLYKQFEKVVASGESITYEDSFVAPSGEKCYLKIKLTPLFDEQKNCKQIVAVIRDITREKLSEIKIKVAWKKLNESKQRYQSLFQNNSDAILLIDLNGRILDGNKSVESVTEYKVDELIGLSLNSIIVEEDVRFVSNLLSMATNGFINKSYLTMKTNTGNKIEVTIKIIPIIIDNGIIGVYCIFRDITSLLESRKKLEESDKRFKIITEHANDLITLVNEKGIIIYASPSYKKMLGYDYKEYVRKLFLHNIHPDDKDDLSKTFVQSIKEGTSFTVQFRQFNYKNEIIWSEASGSPVYGEQQGFKYMVVTTRDIGIHKEYEMKLEYLSMHDSLTGLPNRRFFNKQLEKALNELRTSNNGLAVIMMDIDDFKRINDTFGHDIGDEVIEEFGKRISKAIGKDNIVARLGGDEFVILLPSISSSGSVLSIAKIIQYEMQKTWNIKGHNLDVTTSMGIALSNSNVSPQLILKSSDTALYDAKNTGKNSFKLQEVNKVVSD
ncbi:sensor domain-containing diguanylate cyclase [Ornithinibacillus sp. FSL M8-0202]|uniref:sensor domain-containing diguanylate cyclase n=1 Tax=Ornithinibacillus sp. FSL M8-0202 TaxID=2921616 RepID=UPI0030CD71B3